MKEESEKDLIEAAKIDTNLFGTLYTKYVKRVYGYVWLRVGKSKAVAEELVQDTFLNAFKNLPKFKQRSISYFAYLMRIARNLLVSYYRKQKTVPLEEKHDIPIETVPATERFIDARKVWDMIKKLNPLARKVLMMKYKEGMKIKEIATKTHKSENAVKILLSRSRALIAKRMHMRNRVESKEKPFV